MYHLVDRFINESSRHSISLYECGGVNDMITGRDMIYISIKVIQIYNSYYKPFKLTRFFLNRFHSVYYIGKMPRFVKVKTCFFFNNSLYLVHCGDGKLKYYVASLLVDAFSFSLVKGLCIFYCLYL